jgi:carboxyl-terminal processing protease
MTAADLQQALAFNEETTIKIRLKKNQGTIEEIDLLNETATNEENVIKSYILGSRKKIGYIGLPGFYTQWNGEYGTGSANDLGKELLKLKQENIDGLILDLRFNGGGSVQEAIEIASAFISEGSMSIEEGLGGSLKLLKDPHRGRLYTGGLVVLVNEISASASEITAGILQDHNRAIIVGNKTYGKGTGQILLPLNFYFDEKKQSLQESSDNSGYIKVTTSRYYNLKGKSHQLVGVTPDIELPSFYDVFIDFERNYKNAIPTNSIEKRTYYTPSNKPPLTELKRKSKARIDTTTNYQHVMQLKQAYQKKSKAVTDSLNLAFSPLITFISETEALYNEFNSALNSQHSNFSVSTLSYDQLIYKLNDQKQELAKMHAQELEKDLQIQEAYQILIDLSNLKQ